MKKTICDICGAECNNLFTHLELNKMIMQNEMNILSHRLPARMVNIERDNKQMDLCTKCSHYIEQKIEEMKEEMNNEKV